MDRLPLKDVLKTIESGFNKYAYLKCEQCTFVTPLPSRDEGFSFDYNKYLEMCIDDQCKGKVEEIARVVQKGYDQLDKITDSDKFLYGIGNRNATERIFLKTDKSIEFFKQAYNLSEKYNFPLIQQDIKEKLSEKDGDLILLVSRCSKKQIMTTKNDKQVYVDITYKNKFWRLGGGK